jgi:predicted nucleic acid-binding protein
MATKAVEALLVDTSVLITASNRARDQHRYALDLLGRHPRLVFPAQVIREFLVVATRPPGVNGLGLPLEHALDNLAEFRARIRLLPEEKPLLPTLLRLLADAPVAGKRIHDAHVVAAAIAHRVPRIVTMNEPDFSAFGSKIRIEEPAAAVRAL